LDNFKSSQSPKRKQIKLIFLIYYLKGFEFSLDFYIICGIAVVSLFSACIVGYVSFFFCCCFESNLKKKEDQSVFTVTVGEDSNLSYNNESLNSSSFSFLK
jgi:hypothetical protein